MSMRTGATLLEMLVVLALIAMIAVVLNPVTSHGARIASERSARGARLERLRHEAIASRRSVTDTLHVGDGKAASFATAFPDGNLALDKELVDSVEQTWRQ